MRNRRVLTLSLVALCSLPSPPRADPPGPSPLDRLDPAKIAKDDRFEGQPKELVAILKGHTRAVASLAFAADGKTLASSSWDNKVRLWKLDGVAPVEWAALAGSPSGVAFAPAGLTLAAGGADTKVYLWDVSGAAPKPKAELAGHTQRPFALAYAPGGKLLASGCFGPVLRVWDVRGKEPELWASLADDKVRAWGVSALAFSADGKVLAAGGYAGDGTLRLWDAGGDYLKEWELPKTRARLVAFSPVASLLAFHAEGGTIRLWDLASGKAKERKVLAGHPVRGESGTVKALAFAPDGKTLASSGQDLKVVLWDVAAGKRQREWSLPEEVRALAFAPDSRHLAAGTETGAVFILRLAPPGAVGDSIPGKQSPPRGRPG
jgi:WD40 repeat protein